MRADNHLVIFAKAPRMGQAKRRLARDIGTVAAWAFQRRNLGCTVSRLARDTRWQCWLAMTPDGAVFDPLPRDVETVPQGPGDLGQRMDRVMRDMPPGPVVIVGSDVPGIEPGHAARAFAALGGNDAVFGPASDGGYWLVGLRRRPRVIDLFQRVRWSSEHALADTLANLGAGRRAALLETLADVDDGAAWRRWRAAADA